MRRNNRRRRSEDNFVVDVTFDPDPRDLLPEDAYSTRDDSSCCGCFWYYVLNIFIVVIFALQIFLLCKESQRNSLGSLVGLGDTKINNVNLTNTSQINNSNTKPSFARKNKLLKNKYSKKKNTHFAEATQIEEDLNDKKCCKNCDAKEVENSMKVEAEGELYVDELQNDETEYKSGPSSFSNDEIIQINRQIMNLELELLALREAVNNATIWRESVEVKLNKTQEGVREEERTENLCLVQEKIEEAIEKYDADKSGKTDFALETAGGSIACTPQTVPYPSKATYQIFGLITIHYPSNPRLVIQPGTRPGECFAFHGSRGRIRVKLSHKVNITEVGLEHTSVAYDNTTAPNTFHVYGADDEVEEAQYHLGQFKYELEGKSLQTFPIDAEKSVKFFEFVELYITSNYGHPHYTCVYRFRVHGEAIDEDSNDDIIF